MLKLIEPVLFIGRNIGPDWFDVKICLAKTRAGQNIGKNFLPKPCQVLCEVGSFFGFQPIECQNFWLPKFWQSKFWNQTNQAHNLKSEHDVNRNI